MSRFALLILCVVLTGCGVKRPLIRPADIPAYEQKRAEKMQKMRDERAAHKARDAEK